MATWTPTDLTNPEFVQTKLSPLDRSNALATMNQNLASVQSKLADNMATLDAIQEQTNGQYSFGAVRDARRAANDARAAGAPNAAALQAQFEELQAKRAELTAQADRLVSAIDRGEEAVKTSKLAINNLESAGAVPPGTNQFAAPPGYQGRVDPPQQVPDNQNPNPVSDPAVTAETENVQNALPSSVDSVQPDQAEIDVYAPLEEPPNPDPGEYDEFAGLDDAIAANENTLKEPPLLSDEEVEQALGAVPTQDYEPVTEEDINGGSARGATAQLNNDRSQANQQDSTNAYAQGDWRVRLSLAPGANYLYKATPPGILEPLRETKGVLFPYTPSISVSYAANYDPTDLTHSNYKIYQYRSSSVDNISITCDFTAQDTKEARYVLAVIHFFRSITKMFYGRDQNPVNGTPPPLCYLTGMGAFQFDNHPLAITNFSLNLPTDVDYIRASSTTAIPGTNTGSEVFRDNTVEIATSRLGPGIRPGGTNPAPPFNGTPTGSVEATYVPTKVQIQITAVPIVTRSDISNNFSFKQYATGELLRGSINKGGAGIW